MQKKVLRAIKSVVQGAGIVVPRSVFFTPHETFMPSNTAMPACGVKDGMLQIHEAAGGVERAEISLDIVCWCYMTADGETAVVGDKGLVEISDQVKTLLQGNSLGLVEVQHCGVVSIGGSKLFTSRNKQWLASKVISLKVEAEYHI